MMKDTFTVKEIKEILHKCRNGYKGYAEAWNIIEKEFKNLLMNVGWKEIEREVDRDFIKKIMGN